MLKYEDVIKVRKELTAFYDKISKVYCTDDVILSLMKERGYASQEMYDTLKEVGITYVTYLSDLLLFADASEQQLEDWGLLDKNGNYLLSSRYVVPIRDIEGYVCALVGWDPMGGSRKYVTTPTVGFNRDTTFFNIDNYADKRYNNDDNCVYVVEGIFDTLSLRSLGLRALGNMGLQMSSIKIEILLRWGKVVAIPDNDKAGRSVNPIYNSDTSTKGMWEIKNDHVFVILPLGVKDVDDFIKEFDCIDDLRGCESAQIIKKITEDF